MRAYVIKINNNKKGKMSHLITVCIIKHRRVDVLLNESMYH